MKKNRTSRYEKQVMLENAAGILFCLVLTAFILLNKDTIVELARQIAVSP